MNRKLRVLISLIIALNLYSCNSFNSWLCGELEGVLKENLNQADRLYPDEFEIEPIPCESSYINVYLKTKELDTAKLEHIHSKLYNHKIEQGWGAVDLYDLSGKYLFTHGRNNNIYRRTGD